MGDAHAAARLNAGYGDVDGEAKRKQEVAKMIKDAFFLFDKAPPAPPPACARATLLIRRRPRDGAVLGRAG